MARLISLPNKTLAAANVAEAIADVTNVVAMIFIQSSQDNADDVWVSDLNVDASGRRGTRIEPGKSYVYNPSSISGELERTNVTSLFFDSETISQVISIQVVEVDE